MKDDNDILEKIMETIGRVQDVFVFALDGALFKGCKVSLSKKYAAEKSSKDFKDWLIDEGLLIVEPFDINYIVPKSKSKPK